MWKPGQPSSTQVWSVDLKDFFKFCVGNTKARHCPLTLDVNQMAHTILFEYLETVQDISQVWPCLLISLLHLLRYKWNTILLKNHVADNSNSLMTASHVMVNLPCLLVWHWRASNSDNIISRVCFCINCVSYYVVMLHPLALEIKKIKVKTCI